MPFVAYYWFHTPSMYLPTDRRTTKTTPQKSGSSVAPSKHTHKHMLCSIFDRNCHWCTSGCGGLYWSDYLFIVADVRSLLLICIYVFRNFSRYPHRHDRWTCANLNHIDNKPAMQTANQSLLPSSAHLFHFFLLSGRGWSHRLVKTAFVLLVHGCGCAQVWRTAYFI